MRRALAVVAVVAITVAAVELAAPAWVSSRAEAAVAARTDGLVGVEVDVAGPPLLIPALATGHVAWWTLRLSRAGGRRVPVRVVVELDTVTLDRGRLLRGGVRVTDVGHARVRVDVELSGAVPDLLAPMADRLAEVGLDRLLDAVGGAGVTASGDELVVGDLALPLVGASCRVTADGGVVTTTCDLAEVPPFLVSVLG